MMVTLNKFLKIRLKFSPNLFHTDSRSTIFAVSSGHGKCGVAIIRITGPQASLALKYMAGFSQPPQPRYAYLKSLKNTQNGEVIDKGLVLWFPEALKFYKLMKQNRIVQICIIAKTVSITNEILATTKNKLEFILFNERDEVEISTGTKRLKIQAITCQQLYHIPGPKSFTGEDSCEFQVHGGLAVVNGILSSLSAISSFRIAEPGEFTKRAFSNGKLDLTEVEGLADLLNAETEIQRKQAFLQAQGFLSKIYLQWKNDLSKNLAHLEAVIDFEESENLDVQQENEILNNVIRLKHEIETHLSQGRKGEILRHGVRTVIVGRPNVGKSSLLNILCGRPAAIVTPISGTTRDVLEVKLDISGYPLILVDTAGLRKDSPDIIEVEGMKRAVQQLEEADLVIVMMDASDVSSWKKQNHSFAFKDYLKHYLRILGLNDFWRENELPKKPSIFVLNKTDLFNFEDEEMVTNISCKTEKGIDRLIDCISGNLKEICGEPSKEHPTMNKARHRQHLEDCLKELDMFSSISNQDDNTHENMTDVVILAEHLRRASKHLGKLVGTTTTEQLLDIIFRDFCIGK